MPRRDSASPSADADAPGETSPLLGSEAESPAPSSPSALYPAAILFTFALAFVADVGGSLIGTPEVRLLEMAVCRDYYRTRQPGVIGPPPLSYVNESLCKLDEIQSSLAYLRGTKALLMTLPGILLTYPYGLVSDHIGRKPVLFMGLLGQVMSFFWVLFVCYFHQVFPTSLVLLSPIFLLIGGGNPVMSACLYSVIADVAPDNMRATIFYAIGAVVLVTEAITLPIGSWLLTIDLWLPFKFSTVLLCSSFPLVLAMPETLPPRKDTSEAQNDSLLDDNSNTVPPSKNRLLAFMQEATSNVRQALSTLRISHYSRQVKMCLAITFVFSFATGSNSIFVQYTSKILRWEIASTGYLLSVKSFTSLGVLVLLAGISQTLQRQSRSSSQRVDILSARLSLVCLVVGNVLVGLGRDSASLITGSVLDASGSGLPQALQSLLTSFVEKPSIGQVFATSALIQLLAGLMTSITYAALFDLGLKSGGSWSSGIPFLLSAVLYAVAIIMSGWLPKSVGDEVLVST